MVDFLPEHPAYFPEDQLTDKTERFFVNEIIRNNVLKLYDEEVPYSVEIVTLLFKEEPKILRLSCEVIVERPSQKPIIIGKQGQSIKVGHRIKEGIGAIFPEASVYGTVCESARGLA